MHQSPQKLVAGRRAKDVDLETGDAEAERRLYRGSQPKARKFPLRDEGPRETQREGKQSARH